MCVSQKSQLRHNHLFVLTYTDLLSGSYRPRLGLYDPDNRNISTLESTWSSDVTFTKLINRIMQKRL